MAIHEGVLRSSTAITDNANLVKKLSFPAEILVLAVALAALLHEAIALGAFLVVLGFLGELSLRTLPLLAVAVALQLAITLGLGLLVASLHVFFRDTAQLLGMIFNAWFYLTPIVYPLTLVPEPYRSLDRAQPADRADRPLPAGAVRRPPRAGSRHRRPGARRAGESWPPAWGSSAASSRPSSMRSEREPERLARGLHPVGHSRLTPRTRRRRMPSLAGAHRASRFARLVSVVALVGTAACSQHPAPQTTATAAAQPTAAAPAAPEPVAKPAAPAPAAKPAAGQAREGSRHRGVQPQGGAPDGIWLKDDQGREYYLSR